jgi:hypothetical protein
MPVLPAPCIVLSIQPAPKREVPDSNSGRFAYTGDQDSLVSSYCRDSSAASYLYSCAYNTVSKREVPGSNSGRFAYSGNQASLVVSYCSYARAAGRGIVLSILLGTKREVPGSTSGKFAYTEDQAFLVCFCCRSASVAGSLQCVYILAPKRNVPGSTSGRNAYTRDPSSLVSYLLQVCQCCWLPVLCLYHWLPKERPLVLPQSDLPILGTRLPWSPPTAGMPVQPAPFIVVPKQLHPKREVPGSTSGRFPYTGDQASLISFYCRYASAAGPLYCFVYTSGPQMRGP